MPHHWHEFVESDSSNESRESAWTKVNSPILLKKFAGWVSICDGCFKCAHD